MRISAAFSGGICAAFRAALCAAVSSSIVSSASAQTDWFTQMRAGRTRDARVGKAQVGVNGDGVTRPWFWGGGGQDSFSWDQVNCNFSPMSNTVEWWYVGPVQTTSPGSGSFVPSGAENPLRVFAIEGGVWKTGCGRVDSTSAYVAFASMQSTYNLPPGVYGFNFFASADGTGLLGQAQVAQKGIYVPPLSQLEVRFVDATTKQLLSGVSFNLVMWSNGSSFGAARRFPLTIGTQAPGGVAIVPDVPKSARLTIEFTAGAGNTVKGNATFVGPTQGSRQQIGSTVTIALSNTVAPVVDSSTDNPDAGSGGSGGGSVFDISAAFTPSSDVLDGWSARWDRLAGWGPWGLLRTFAGVWLGTGRSLAVDAGPETAPVYPISVSLDGGSTSGLTVLDFRPGVTVAYPDGRFGSFFGTLWQYVRGFVGVMVYIGYFVALYRYIRPRLTV